VLAFNIMIVLGLDGEVVCVVSFEGLGWLRFWCLNFGVGLDRFILRSWGRLLVVAITCQL
jgi:hypothetical protein